MHESIRPVAGAIAPLALMGVRCFRPDTMIGRDGLEHQQASKLRVRADEPSGSTSHSYALTGVAQCAVGSCQGMALRPGQQCPSESRGLVCQGNHSAVEAAPLNECLQPVRPCIVALRHLKGDSTSAVDHLPTQIMVGAPADAAEPRLAARRVLPRHKTDPSGKLAPASEPSTIADAGDKRCGDERTHTGQNRQTPGRLVLAADRHDARIKRLDPLVDIAELVKQLCQELAREIRQLRISYRFRCPGGEAGGSAWKDNPILGKKTHTRQEDHECG